MTLGAPECSPFVAMLVEEVDSSLLQLFSDAILLFNSVMAQGFLGLPFWFRTSGYLMPTRKEIHLKSTFFFSFVCINQSE